MLTRADVVLRLPEVKGVDRRKLEVRKTGVVVVIIEKDSWGSSYLYDIYGGNTGNYLGYRGELEDAIQFALDQWNAIIGKVDSGL